MESTPSRRFSAHDAELAMREETRALDGADMPSLGTMVTTTSSSTWALRGNRSSDKREEASVKLEPFDVDAQTLDAFLASQEENPIHFAASFLHLTLEDRVQMATALLEEKRQQQHHHVDVTDEESLKALLSSEVQKLKEGKGLVKTAAEKEHDAQQRQLGFCPPEELEMIDLEETEAVHTGNMALFFSKGKTDVQTVYDNFFDEDATGASAPLTTADNDTKGVERDVCLEFYQETVIPAHIPSLDDFLNCDDTPVRAPQGTAAEKETLPKDTTTTTTTTASTDIVAQEDDEPQSEEDDVQDDEEEELDLPGLEGVPADENIEPPEEEDKTSSPTRRPATANTKMLPHNTDFALTQKELQELRKEMDNSVQPFHLDPLVDYNRDLVGAAFREHGWRETDVKQTPS